MTTILFDPKDHLSVADQRRLEAMAKEQGVTVDELIEVTLKREIFARPTSRAKKGGAK